MWNHIWVTAAIGNSNFSTEFSIAPNKYLQHHHIAYAFNGWNDIYLVSNIHSSLLFMQRCELVRILV